jgi:hypothetical protein
MILANIITRLESQRLPFSPDNGCESGLPECEPLSRYVWNLGELSE